MLRTVGDIASYLFKALENFIPQKRSDNINMRLNIACSSLISFSLLMEPF